MKTIIAIDPGAIGGIAYSCNGEVIAQKMPDTPADIRDLLEPFKGDAIDPSEAIIYMERVGTYMPGNSGPSAATFAEHVGALKGIICCLRIPVHFPTPQSWMNAFIGKQTYVEKKADYDPKAWKVILGRRKTERKNKIKAKAQQIYPHLKVTLKTADALGMLYVGCQAEKDNLL